MSSKLFPFVTAIWASCFPRRCDRALSTLHSCNLFVQQFAWPYANLLVTSQCPQVFWLRRNHHCFFQITDCQDFTHYMASCFLLLSNCLLIAFSFWGDALSLKFFFFYFPLDKSLLLAEVWYSLSNRRLVHQLTNIAQVPLVTSACPRQGNSWRCGGWASKSHKIHLFFMEHNHCSLERRCNFKGSPGTTWCLASLMLYLVKELEFTSTIGAVGLVKRGLLETHKNQATGLF